jgi:hypothetical protein
MALTIDQLLTPPNAEQTLDNFLSSLETLGIKARSWRTGGVARTILAVVATLYVTFVTLIHSVIKSAFLEHAEGDWLTLLARNLFGVERPTATFANGNVTLTNNGALPFNQTAQSVRFLWTAKKKAYVNTGAFTLAPGETKSIPIQAVEIGAASSAPPGAIDAFETVLFGVTVTNPEAVVGADAASDTRLKEICRAKRAAVSVRGPRGAYEYAIQTAVRNDGSPVDVNRYAISPSSSTGVVNIHVASPAGAPDPTDLTYIRDNVEIIARPDSVTVNVLAATTVPVVRTLTVWARRVDGLSVADLTTKVNDALISAIASYRIGGLPKPPITQGYLYADFIAGVVKSADASIYDVDGTGADVALNPGEVATLATTLVIKIVEVY